MLTVDILCDKIIMEYLVTNQYFRQLCVKMFNIFTLGRRLSGDERAEVYRCA